MTFRKRETLLEEVRGTLPRQLTEQKFYAVSMVGGVRAGNGLILSVLLFSKFLDL